MENQFPSLAEIFEEGGVTEKLHSTLTEQYDKTNSALEALEAKKAKIAEKLKAAELEVNRFKEKNKKFDTHNKIVAGATYLSYFSKTAALNGRGFTDAEKQNAEFYTGVMRRLFQNPQFVSIAVSAIEAERSIHAERSGAGETAKEEVTTNEPY